MVKLKMIRKILLFSPGQFFRYRSKNLRHYYSIFSKYLHFYTYLKRCIYRPVKLENIINFEDGYLALKNINLPNSFFKEVNNILKKIDLEKEIQNTEKSIITINKNNFDGNSQVFKAITLDKILNPIINYLDCIPILSYIAIWYSPNIKNIKQSSQLFHLDHEDYRQIKGFIFLEDVTEESGPLVILRKKDSDIIQNKLKYKMTEQNKRIDDKILADYKKIYLTGSKGTVILLDTSSCLHFGSRKASKSRLLLSFQYITPFAFVLPWFWYLSKKTKIVKNIDSKSSLILRIVGKKI